MNNICIISQCQQVLGVGGTETVSYLLKEELRRNGYNVWSAFFIPKAEITAYDLQFPNSGDYLTAENKSFFIDRINEKRIKIVLIQGECDSFLMDICIEAKNVTGTKLVCAYHFNPMMRIKVYDDFIERRVRSSHPLARPFLKLYFEFRRNTAKAQALGAIKGDFRKQDIESIDAFVALNEEYTDFIRGLFPTQYGHKFHTIANPIVMDNSEKMTDKENIVLFVGRLTSQKRLDRLLYIWHKICKRHSNWKLLVVGDGKYSSEYKGLARRLKLDNIEFAGQKPAEDYFKKSRIICMTSSHEGFPMVLIEAQKNGCVPIAYNSFEAATDIIKDGYNGLLIKPFRENEYAKALDSLISNGLLREQLAHNGISYIEKFNIKSIVKHWISLFNSL